MRDWNEEPLRLSELNGAVLTYNDGDGNRVRVEFDEKD